MSTSTKTYNQETDFSFNASDIEFSSGALRLVGPAYATTNPSFTTTATFSTEEIYTLLFSTTIAGSDSITGVLYRGTSPLYWDGSAWSTSDETYAQSSTVADLTTNISSLNDEEYNTYSFKGFLHSNDGSTTPALASIAFNYYDSISFLPVSSVRDFLEGYCVTSTILTADWIRKRRDNFIIPYAERLLGFDLAEENTITEYLSGKEREILMLSHKGVTELVSLEYVRGGDYDSSIGLGGVILIGDQGIIKSVSNISEGRSSTIFRKGTRNIKAVYKVGDVAVSADIEEALLYLLCEQLLGFLGARTGGGSLSVQGFTRNYGSRGKYQDIRNDLKRQAMGLLKKYISSVTGDI